MTPKIHSAGRGLREIQRCDARNMVASTVELAKSYLAEFPDHGFIWLYYADALRAMARYTEALSALRRARSLGPPTKRHLVYFRFGQVYQDQGSFRHAERWYRKAVEARPSDATYRIFLGGFLATAGRLEEAEAIHRTATGTFSAGSALS